MDPRSSTFRIKWPGGKRWLAQQLVGGLSSTYFSDGVCEPFAGGAALSFALPRGIDLHLNDANSELMTTYKVIRDCPEILAERLSVLTIDAETFGRMRNEAGETDLDRAARFIYLNKTAFAGLWRVNARGEFNVPFGCKPTTALPTVDQLLQTSRHLSTARFESTDFEDVAHRTDAALVYLDPPYTVAHNQNGFIRYNERLFSWSDQERLAASAHALHLDGKFVIVSNALQHDVVDLYRAVDFKLYSVERVSNLAARSSARGKAEELLAVSPNVRFRTLPVAATRKR